MYVYILYKCKCHESDVAGLTFNFEMLLKFKCKVKTGNVRANIGQSKVAAGIGIDLVCFLASC